MDMLRKRALCIPDNFYSAPLYSQDTGCWVLKSIPPRQAVPEHCFALRHALRMRAGYYHVPGVFLGEVALYEPNLLSLLPPDVFRLIESYCEVPSVAAIKRGFGQWMWKKRALPPHERLLLEDH